MYSGTLASPLDISYAGFDKRGAAETVGKVDNFKVDSTLSP